MKHEARQRYELGKGCKNVFVIFSRCDSGFARWWGGLRVFARSQEMGAVATMV